MFNFPAPATPGQIYAPPGGPVYRFDDPVWTAVTGAPSSAFGDAVFDQSITGSFASNQVPPARIHRIADRLFIGEGVTMDGTWFSTSQPAGITPKTAKLHGWAPREATVWCDATQGRYALVGHSQTSLSDTPPEAGFYGGSIGVAGFAINDRTLGNAWAGYFDAVKLEGSNFTVGIEVAIANLTTNTNAITPYNVKGGGGARGVALWVQSGCGLDSNGYDGSLGTVAHAAAGLVFLSSYADNSIRFSSGIVFQDKSIVGTDGVTGTGVAISLAKGHTISQFTSGNVLGANIVFDVSDATKGTNLSFKDNFFQFSTSGGISLLMENATAGGAIPVNYPRLQAVGAGAGPIIVAGGTDTNISLELRGKGTGGVYLRDGVASAKVIVTSTGVGFQGTNPVVKQTVPAAATDPATTMALVNSIRTALINYGLAI